MINCVKPVGSPPGPDPGMGGAAVALHWRVVQKELPERRVGNDWRNQEPPAKTQECQAGMLKIAVPQTHVNSDFDDNHQFANLFKPGGFASQPINDVYNNSQSISPAQTQMMNQDNQDMLNNAGPGGRPSTGAPPRRENRDSREPRDSMLQTHENRVFDDSHQLFFGNVPRGATEDELREIFSKFGRIIDLRIHTKSQQKSARQLPNYGFITFEDQQAVQNCLNARVSFLFPVFRFWTKFGPFLNKKWICRVRFSL